MLFTEIERSSRVNLAGGERILKEIFSNRREYLKKINDQLSQTSRANGA